MVYGVETLGGDEVTQQALVTYIREEILESSLLRGSVRKSAFWSLKDSPHQGPDTLGLQNGEKWIYIAL